MGSSMSVLDKVLIGPTLSSRSPAQPSSSAPVLDFLHLELLGLHVRHVLTTQTLGRTRVGGSVLRTAREVRSPAVQFAFWGRGSLRRGLPKLAQMWLKR